MRWALEWSLLIVSNDLSLLASNHNNEQRPLLCLFPRDELQTAHDCTLSPSSAAEIDLSFDMYFMVFLVVAFGPTEIDMLTRSGPAL